jgi:glycine cleavage system H protein
MQIPAELRYTSEHEWVRTGEGVLRVGITDYAQEQLGDIVFVTLPEPGTMVEAGRPMGEVESTKSVSEIYAPVSGTVTGRNDALTDTPDLVNTDPYGQGWLVEIEASGDEDLADLLDAPAYEELIGV